MIEIADTLVSRDLVERYFSCDLPHCRGLCCVEGDVGAPLEKSEAGELRKLLPVIWNDLSPTAKQVINERGMFCFDSEGEMVTSIVDGKDCVFTGYDEDGVCRCTIEKAYYEGKTDFRKPVSCHLYPVRVRQYNHYKAVNYDRWHVCKAAEVFGQSAKMLLYQFLKEPLIRKFGHEWFSALDTCAKELQKRNIQTL
jgi:hypothetical protein